MPTVGAEDDIFVCAICRALAHACAPDGGAPRRALLLLHAQRRPALHAALAQVAWALDARSGRGCAAPAAAPLCAAARELCERVPSSACAADFERVDVRYLGAAEAAAAAAAAPPRVGQPPPPPPLLRFASHLHLLPAAAAPSWVGLVEPELLCGGGAPDGAVDAFQLAAAVALLASVGRAGAPTEVHVQLQAGGWARSGPAVKRLLQRDSLCFLGGGPLV
jgi:hypothetical protein